VDETEKAINRMAVLSQSPEIVQQLLLFETYAFHSTVLPQG
jgi:hypothetical protein